MNPKLNDYRQQMKRFNKVVIWGLRSSNHSHGYIHSHFYHTLRKLETPAAWVDDSPENQSLVEVNDLVIAVNVACNHLPLRDRVYYCFHNCDHEMRLKISRPYRLTLQVYTNTMENNSDPWGQATFFNYNSKTLYQPWATELLPEEFEPPVPQSRSNRVYWVGSIWDNELHQGNKGEIAQLQKELAKYQIKISHVTGVSDSQNRELVRASRLAPAIAGGWQVANDYLPCRMWKNISYGQLGISNVRMFQNIFKGCSIPGSTIAELIDYTLTLPYPRYRELILEQQEIVKNHTYLDRLLHIAKAFDFLHD